MDTLKTGGTFYCRIIRDGELIEEFEAKNLFTNEGLVYALNCAFGVSVGGAPSAKSSFYVGLSGANSAWDGTEVGSTVHTDRSEIEDYASATRPAWAPSALATTGSIQLSDSGAEATFVMNADATVYGAFLISTNTKNGTGDSSATLAAGANFTGGSRSLLNGDTFKIGYVLQNQSA